MSRKNIERLELNYAKGWRGQSLEFLCGLTELKSLKVLDWKIESIDSIHELVSLEELQLTTGCNSPIEFDRFPRLESVALEWREGATSLFSQMNLRSVFINEYSGADLDAFRDLANLRRLSLAGPKIDRIGSSTLEKLQGLEIKGAKRLSSLEGLEGYRSLASLELNGCPRIADISALNSLEKLERLHLCDGGKIRSLAPLRGLPHLEEVLFYGSTVIEDGDLTPLVNRGLEKIAFQDRPSYSHRLAELESRKTPAER